MLRHKSQKLARTCWECLHFTGIFVCSHRKVSSMTGQTQLLFFAIESPISGIMPRKYLLMESKGMNDAATTWQNV